MKKTLLRNGLMIYYYPIENAYSTVIGLYINTGTRNEPCALNGITHLLEHLHFRKLGDLPQHALYFSLDKIGAVLKASTHRELLRFYMKFRPIHFKVGIDVFSNIISTYDWSTDDLESEKKVVLNEISEKKFRLLY